MKWLWALLLSVFVSAPAFAQTPNTYGITTKNLGGGLRERTIFFYGLADYTGMSATVDASALGGYGPDTRLGKHGVMATRVCGNAATSCDATKTSSAASSIPEVGGIFPARRVWVAFDDWQFDSTPSCTGVQIWGKGADGENLYERMVTVNETGQKSKFAYANIHRLYATGCTGVGAKDELFAQATQDVALGGDVVTTASELVSICTVISSIPYCLGSEQMKHYENATSWFHTASGTLNLDQINTNTDTESPVDLALDTLGTPTWITWRLKNR